jgi:hypothetical protein
LHCKPWYIAEHRPGYHARASQQRSFEKRLREDCELAVLVSASKLDTVMSIVLGSVESEVVEGEAWIGMSAHLIDNLLRICGDKHVEGTCASYSLSCRVVLYDSQGSAQRSDAVAVALLFRTRSAGITHSYMNPKVKEVGRTACLIARRRPEVQHLLSQCSASSASMRRGLEVPIQVG